MVDNKMPRMIAKAFHSKPHVIIFYLRSSQVQQMMYLCICQDECVLVCICCFNFTLMTNKASITQLPASLMCDKSHQHKMSKPDDTI